MEMDIESQLRNNIFVNNLNERRNSPKLNIFYPQVDKIILHLSFNNNGYEKFDTMEFSHVDLSYFKIECINRECLVGGFDLSNLIRELVLSKNCELDGHLICNGYQDYKRYTAKQYHCLCKLNYKIEIRYINSPNGANR